MRKRQRLPDEHTNHDRWLVSYSDFITLLFAFFVVMYASTAVNATKYKQVAESIEFAFNAIPVALEAKEIPTTSPVVPKSLPIEPSFAENTIQLITLQTTIDELTQSRQSIQTTLLAQTDQQEILKIELSEQAAEKEIMQSILQKMDEQLRLSTKLNKILTGANTARNELLENIQNSLFAQGIQVEIDLRNGILRLPETLLFESGKAELREGGTKALRIASENLMRILSCYAEPVKIVSAQDPCNPLGSGYRLRLESVFIEGHTDSVPIANAAFKGNWDLSIARAKNTYLELIKVEPALETLENERQQPLVSFSAYAGRRPIIENTSEATRRKNRRIDLRFIMAQPTINSDLSFLNQP